MSIEFRGVEYSDKGGLQEMAATLARAKSDVDEVMNAIPAEVDVSTSDLEHAVELIGRVEHDLDGETEER